VSVYRRFDKLLIANRGEIACRIMRTARRMGLRTVAVFSDADRDALHVTLADEAVSIGRAPASESYLNIEALLAAARKTGAGGVHPGYGFLAENADFAQACTDAGLVFVGPSAETMRLMGSKAAAKSLMQAAGVPVVPGFHGREQDLPTLQQAAERIGYPLLIKASAGGGGRGMRLVHGGGEFPEALTGAKREAKASFGNDAVLLEKYLMRPRHIELQVFGDSRGNIVSLHERECTLQRRHQKVVEEAPAILLTEARRSEMAAAAREAAHAVRYVGAGTVEFVVDASGFYFIEMNTRLQVEHPVTEMILGLDLVEWQLRVAFAESLPRQQHEISARGHAIEARIYAEDADKGFLPSTGTIRSWKEPQGTGIRVDTGFRAGDTVTPYYDALLAKLIVWADDRNAALARMIEALRDFEIAGVTTNLAFLSALLQHPQVARGEIDTGFIERELPKLTGERPLTALDMAAACAAVILREPEPTAAEADPSPWDASNGWTLAGRRSRRLSFRAHGRQHDAVLWYDRNGVVLEYDGAQTPLHCNSIGETDFAVMLGDASERASAIWSGRELDLKTQRGRLHLHWIDPFAGEIGEAAAARGIIAPMPGTVTRILAQPGEDVARGAPLLVLEAMKMEHILRAPSDGHLRALKCAVGDFVQEGSELADFEPAGGGDTSP
jgi:3-methylcrotonyl-CoA carboxylase alpha subunit